MDPDIFGPCKKIYTFFYQKKRFKIPGHILFPFSFVVICMAPDPSISVGGIGSKFNKSGFATLLCTGGMSKDCQYESQGACGGCYVTQYS